MILNMRDLELATFLVWPYIQIYKKIVDKIDKKIRVFFVGAGNKTIKSSIFLKINSTTMHGTNVSFEHNSQFIDRFTIPTIGKHNIENASVVAGLLLADGKHYEKIITALK